MKRFIGSKDPQLDISLDAQLGDIRATIKAAKNLPEARGKKLLLIGHGEGGLLSLMAASEADALLLLGMPAQSMGKTILAQLKPQLPPESVAANLAFMETAFQAIRQGKPTPEGTSAVYPQIVTLAKSLMRSESLDFVRSTLDLDPWLLAARISVPCALVWGDRDVQNSKPERIPDTFKGTVIELPEANHLLRKETRPRSELNGANAGAGYGGDTPTGDFAPIADWLKRIR